MKVLVTGGGGFLGSAICRELMKRGYQVCNFSRGSYPHLEKMGIKCFRGDIADSSALTEALQGVEAVIHCAALAGVWGRDEDFHRINVVGTQNVVDSMKLNGVKYLVYTSSPSVVFGREDIVNGDESLPYPKKFYCTYAATKAQAEQFVLDNADDEFYPLALRPHLIWGPGDPHIFPRIIQKARAGKLRQVGDGQNRVDTIYIDNAATAHVDALEHALKSERLKGQSYFIGQNEPVYLWDFINKVLLGHDIEALEDRVSFSKAFKLGLVLEKVFSLAGIRRPEPPMTRFVALQLAKNHFFRHDKAREHFSFNPSVSTEEGLKRVFSMRRKDIIDQTFLEKTGEQ